MSDLDMSFCQLYLPPFCVGTQLVRIVRPILLQQLLCLVVVFPVVRNRNEGGGGAKMRRGRGREGGARAEKTGKRREGVVLA